MVKSGRVLKSTDSTTNEKPSIYFIREMRNHITKWWKVALSQHPPQNHLEIADHSPQAQKPHASFHHLENSGARQVSRRLTFDVDSPITHLEEDSAHSGLIITREFLTPPRPPPKEIFRQIASSITTSLAKRRKSPESRSSERGKSTPKRKPEREVSEQSQQSQRSTDLCSPEPIAVSKEFQAKENHRSEQPTTPSQNEVEIQIDFPQESLQTLQQQAEETRESQEEQGRQTEERAEEDQQSQHSTSLSPPEKQQNEPSQKAQNQRADLLLDTPATRQKNSMTLENVRIGSNVRVRLAIKGKRDREGDPLFFTVSGAITGRINEFTFLQPFHETAYSGKETLELPGEWIVAEISEISAEESV